MKKLLLIATLTTLGVRVTHAQTFPIITVVPAGKTQNVLQLSASLNKSDTRLSLMNNGLVTLRFFMTNSATSTAAARVIDVSAGQTVQASVMQLGGNATNPFLNVTNLATDLIKTATAVVDRVLITVITPSLTPTFTKSPLCIFSAIPQPVEWISQIGSVYTCTGNVGIATPNPLTTFDVAGDGVVEGNLNVNFNSRTYGDFTVNGNTNLGTLTITAPNQTGLTLNHLSGSDYDYASTITVNRNLTKAFVIQNSTLPSNNGADNGVFRVWGDGKTYVAGGLGIGSELSSGYMLSVNGNSTIAGNVHCKSINIDLTNYPDFVFDKTYKLRSLKELEAYIAINHHLPEIPSAAEIENKGADLGEIVKLQMQKIEELSLYTINLQKQLETQQMEIKSLEKQIHR